MAGSPRRQAGDHLEQLAAELAAMRREIDALKRRPLILPVLNADPPDLVPGQPWMLGDGRIRVADVDGVVKNYVSTGDGDPWPDIPTRSTNPAADTGIDLWLDGATGQLRARLANGKIVRFAPVTATASGATPPKPAASGGSAKQKPPDVPKVTRTRSYDSGWAASWCPRHGWEAGADLRYGYYDGTHGERRVMIGLPDAAIRADLAGAAIVKVEVYLANIDSYSHAGVDISLGGHNNTNRPDDYTGVVRRGVTRRHFGENDAKFVTVDTWFGVKLRDNDIKGLLVDQPSTARNLYGAISGAGSSRPPRIRITYRS